MAAPIRTRVDDLVAANAGWAESYVVPPPMKLMRERPDNPVFVLTCMDPRVVPEDFLGPQPRVAVFRNAGGRYSPDVVRSIAILRTLVRKAEGGTLMVVHHTDCGATHITHDDVCEKAKIHNPSIGDEVRDLDFNLFTEENLDGSVVEDVEKLRASDLLRGMEVRGFVLDGETGLLREIHI